MVAASPDLNFHRKGAHCRQAKSFSKDLSPWQVATSKKVWGSPVEARGGGEVPGPGLAQLPAHNHDHNDNRNDDDDHDRDYDDEGPGQ